jgi:hypothetical protein
MELSLDRSLLAPVFDGGHLVGVRLERFSLERFPDCKVLKFGIRIRSRVG